ncbi:MAG TPA: hypothetical protein DCQ26_01680 [Marinilabiliales bacterium]|jgi:uncharacterized membrane protein YccC|nr:MAG: hypothetical protein A2W95_12855 [Bacteroidetes bacterium GWA2_40_14]OFX59160.1 MAG: hypothetical protein A2W84_18225 [Bacteroidetes bacterium GWC2_40_13]OFX73117.1 MAG: hypothetical protein A2W96_02285 [Bacteroidetes bacterium GWD2_40_43]OFX95141.1 MAG: hypothetical protein A2W97_11090 [Bacteroidetes bacterium GWE2_40_63]OFY19224.1 MAG: hypothetical protein A2W88_07295 [Bacteroidetes bacterium GWF2_40_13]OFZ30806.1 MAG: hypothetical protein A2437_11500 [Bacteroidetes bacterium RIFOXYC
MKKIFFALSIGIAAGIIDAVPMILQDLNPYASVSAFVHWVVLGLIIPFVSWNMKGWLKGILVGLLALLPVMVLVSEKEPLSLIPMTLFSVLLGAAVGWAGEKWVSSL